MLTYEYNGDFLIDHRSHVIARNNIVIIYHTLKLDTYTGIS